MTGPVSDRDAMVAQMSPSLDDHAYCFLLISPETAPTALGAAIGTFREDEGVTAIVPEATARELGDDSAAFARITLQVHSALEGVGLTAAVSGALADAGIACNMVAAFHHDHVFVPAERAEEALLALKKLQAGRRRA
ncbi:MAG: ACT domain-containing protein [Altererythrobacter sp.]|nr:ACT domain-containing protein [Altererythrobacter sp.]MBT8431791.1 ACT domain-containing protein [Altererythrobacter sp.]NNE50378.1 ACT domain-containing protein [Altererythrobacter sp.]NNF93843.1 ACT domain-containing protein [Altererythrobacter sp.]NNK45479.1 ACT domain-containing protein [Altererythrobacter sp.]